MLNILSLYCNTDSQKISIENIDFPENSYFLIHVKTETNVMYYSKKIYFKPHTIIIIKNHNNNLFSFLSPCFYDLLNFDGDLDTLTRELSFKIEKPFHPNNTLFIEEYFKDLQSEYYNSRQYRNKLLSLKTEEFIIKLAREISGELIYGSKAKYILTEFDFENIWCTTETYPKLITFNKVNNQEIKIWNGKTSPPLITKENGTKNNPILINNAEELAYIITDKNASDYKYYKLANDIYLNDINKVDWSNGKVLDPSYKINTWYSNPNLPVFNGSINGDGHIIYGLYYNSFNTIDDFDVIGAGLFPVVGNINISQIGIDNSFLRYYDNFSLGCIIGKAQNTGNGNIEKCYLGSSVTVIGHDAGGIAGGGDLGNDKTITIRNCYSLAKISGDRYIGAFVGNSWTHGNWIIENCYCLGKPYGATWKMPTIKNVFSTEQSTGNLSVLIANDAPDDYSQKTIMDFRILRGKMFNSLNNKWTVELMANEVNLSTSRFQHIYKEIYKISPISDIINERIRRALYLLKHTNIDITEISSLLGYDNATHFSRQFKRIIGVSPLTYRKSQSQNIN